MCRVWTVDSGYNESSRRTSVPMSAAAGPGQHSLCCYDPSPGSGTDLVADHGNIADTCHQLALAASTSRCCSSCGAVPGDQGRKRGIKVGEAETVITCYHGAACPRPGAGTPSLACCCCCCWSPKFTLTHCEHDIETLWKHCNYYVL